jgi:regulation of enolase protein 1 (concanavalin A-like superfamily)
MNPDRRAFLRTSLILGLLLVRSRPKTDFWRKTFYGYVTDNGHFFRLTAAGDCTFLARVNGQYTALYDQAGLMGSPRRGKLDEMWHGIF